MTTDTRYDSEVLCGTSSSCAASGTGMWGGVEIHAYLTHGFDLLCTGLQPGQKPPRPEVRGHRDVSAVEGGRCRITCTFRVILRHGSG